MDLTLISPYPDIECFGLRSISSYSKSKGCKVQIIFMPNQFTEPYRPEIFDEVARICEDSGVIGISLMTNFFDNAVQITRELKHRLDAPILWGGIHATIRPEECLDYADIVSVGEAEKSVFELLTRMRKREECRETPGFWAKRGREIIKCEPPRFVEDLNSLPFPDYDLCTQYILDEGGIKKMDDSLLQKYLGWVYTTMPTRGCINQCSYCCNNTLKKKFGKSHFFRNRSIDNVIMELASVREKMPFIEYIRFDDDSFFNLPLSWMVDFEREYKRTVGLPLIITGITPLTLDKEKLKIIISAGLVGVRMGIQTGSQRIRKLYGRKETNQEILEATHLISSFKHRLQRIQYDFILDNPWEKEEETIETLRFLAKIPKPYTLKLFSLTFYPGTALYEKAKKENLIKDDLNDVYRKYYHQCKTTYLNSLFLIIMNHWIPVWLIYILTNEKIARFIQFFYDIKLFLKCKRIYQKLVRLRELISKGITALFRGDSSKIINFLKKKFLRDV